jgi:hypothetical protein
LEFGYRGGKIALYAPAPADPMKIPGLVLLVAAMLAQAHAESKDCINPHLVVSDGRITTSQFEPSVNGVNPTYWYAFLAQAGHSYSVEFVPTVDNENMPAAIHFTNLTLWGPNDIANLQSKACRGGTTLSWYSTQKYAPAVTNGLYGAGQRVSLVQPVAGLNIVAITNTQGGGVYSYRITDTTLFNARWSTLSGYDSHWSFTNLSDMAITGTLNVYESAGRLLVSAPVALPPGGHSSHFTAPSDLNIPRNDAGYAVFSHNGPPQAILADSYMVNSDASVLIFVKFESRSQQ